MQMGLHYRSTNLTKYSAGQDFPVLLHHTAKQYLLKSLNGIDDNVSNICALCHRGNQRSKNGGPNREIAVNLVYSRGLNRRELGLITTSHNIKHAQSFSPRHCNTDVLLD